MINYRNIIDELNPDEWMIPEKFLTEHEEFLQTLVNKVEEKVKEEISISTSIRENSITFLNLDYTHNKTGNLYTVLHIETINATNEQDGEQMVIYTKEGKLFTREFNQFNEKFTLYVEPIKKGDLVILPHSEEGIVTHIKNIPWGFKYEVLITKGSPINDEKTIVDFREEDLTIINY
jgi:hypothetical protein